MRLIKFIVIWALFWFPMLIFPCTTAIISGKATVDGRPLLWKHRDSGFGQNVIRYFTDGHYKYMGLVNAIDTLGKEIWAGVNQAGFAIMNAASYNLKPTTDTTSLKDKEGELMKKALQVCATLQDFETLLDTLPKPLGVESNFGVIDAFGGAAYYETDNFHYTKLDVNDPRVAPEGFLVHTNFSFTGELNQGKGYIRYQMANELLTQAQASNQLKAAFLLQKASRCLQHALTRQDLRKTSATFVSFRDFIPRYSSVAVVVVQGVKAGENPNHSVMWTILGFPLTSVSFPLWVANMENIPDVLKPANDHNAPLCKASLILKEKCFPIKRGSGKDYLNLPVVWNAKGNGILQKIMTLESNILQKSEVLEKELVKGTNEKKKIQQFYLSIQQLVKEFYLTNFHLKLE